MEECEKTMQDSFHRTIEYLRVSVTDRCNLRCVYCMPPEGIEAVPHTRILRYEEMERIVRAAAGLGVRSVRMTGGEPLVRLGVTDLVRMVADIPVIEEISMTTNGVLLARYAHELAEAGVGSMSVWTHCAGTASPRSPAEIIWPMCWRASRLRSGRDWRR